MRFKPKFSHRLKRFGGWLKQVILLGRTDWRKASDDANPPRLSRAEREELRPRFDLNAIKPRILSAAERPSRLEAQPEVELLPAPAPEPTSAESPGLRRRRRRHARQTAVNPLTAFTSDKRPPSKLAVFVEKLFGGRG